MFRQMSSTLRRASARRLGTASLPASGNPAPEQKGQGMLAALGESASVIKAAGLIAGGCAALFSGGYYALGEINGLKSDIKNLKENVDKNVATKTELTKVETELKSLATKEAVGRVQAKMEEVAKNATQDGRNAALEVLTVKDAAKEGGREAAAKASRGWFA
jgi:hypothetical protein